MWPKQTGIGPTQNAEAEVGGADRVWCFKLYAAFVDKKKKSTGGTPVARTPPARYVDRFLALSQLY